MSTAPASLTAALAEAAAAAPTLSRGPVEDAIDELRSSGTTAGLELGERAPECALPDQLGRVVRLSEQLARGPLVLVFYRGDWCPFCTLTLQALQDELEAITAAGGELLAISPQAPDNALTLAEKHALEFPVLSDVSPATIAAYRLRHPVPPALQEVLLGRFGSDLREQNADGTWNLPVPGTFVIDGAGVVRARLVDADWRTRMEPADIVSALAGLTLSER